MKKLLLLLIILTAHFGVSAQTAPADTSPKKSTVKTLNSKQYNALLNGDDLYGMALVAEMNHYPNPEKVIKYQKELDLTPEQVTKLTAVNKELHRKKLEMGLIIIRNERTLDSLFHTRKLDNGTLIFYANRYGLYQGELRNAILQTFLVTRGLLTPPQLSKYIALQKGI